VRIFRRTIHGEQFGKVAENVLSQLGSVWNLAVHFGIQIGPAPFQKQGQERVPCALITPAVTFANQVEKAL
jgi:hypothetical protein